MATVAAGHDTLLLALIRLVTLLTAVAALHRLTGWAVTRKMTHLAAILALNSLGGAWLVAIASLVAGLLAVATNIAVLARARAVTDTVSGLLAVGAGDRGPVPSLYLLLRAGSGAVTDLSAVVALLLEAVHDESSVLEASHVLFRARWPAGSELWTTWLVGMLEGDHVLTAGLAFEVDDGVGTEDLLLLRVVSTSYNGQQCSTTYLGNKVGVEVVVTEALL